MAHKELADQHFRGENYPAAAAEYTHAINMCTGLQAIERSCLPTEGWPSKEQVAVW